MQEYFADVFGNSVSSDMSTDLIKHVVKYRYPYVRYDTPEFRKK